MARPRKDLDKQHINRIAVYLTDQDYDLLEALSNKTGVAVAVLCRQYIKNKLNFVTSSTLASRLQRLSAP